MRTASRTVSHRQIERLFAKIGANPSRHDGDGWLSVEQEVPAAVLGDRGPIEALIGPDTAAFADIGQPIDGLLGLAEARADPNDWRLVCENAVVVRYTPSTRDHRRTGARERVLEMVQRYPDRLRIEFDALATRVTLDAGSRATGVEYLKGARLCRAHGQPVTAPGIPMRAAVAK